jgi:hypothetical protein
MITGKQKEQKQFDNELKIGIVNVEILGVCLSNSELKELGYYVNEDDVDIEREFTGEKDVDGENVKTVRIEFAVQQVTANENPYRAKLSFFLEDRERFNKDGSSQQWIDVQGRTTWAPDEDTLPEWFKNKDYRKARVGEEELYDFLRNVYNLDFSSTDEEAKIEYSLKDFFKGNFRELKKDIEGNAGTGLIAVTVKTKLTTDDEGNTTEKQFNNFYNKTFAPGDQFKHLNNKKKWSETDVDAIHKKIENNKGKKGKSRLYVSNLEYMIAKLTDSAYPPRDAVYLGLLKDFNPDEQLETSNKVLDSSSADY